MTWAACTSPASRDLTGQPDGRYVLRIRAVDTRRQQRRRGVRRLRPRHTARRAGVHRRPGAGLARRVGHSHVVGRGRRDVPLPDDARGRVRTRLGRVHEPAHRRHRRRSRRVVLARRIGDRRRRQRDPRRRPGTSRSTGRPRPRRSTTRRRPTARATGRPSGRSPASRARTTSAASSRAARCVYDWRDVRQPAEGRPARARGRRLLAARPRDRRGGQRRRCRSPTGYRLDTTDPDAPEMTTKPRPTARTARRRGSSRRRPGPRSSAA